MDGVLQAVETRMAQLLARLGPVLTDVDTILKVAKELQKEREDAMAPRSEVAQRVAGFTSRLGAIEHLAEAATLRLGV
jgi:hypothetical protein